jgi:phosphoribosylformylglycinamidine synthase subunit PurL
VAQQPLHRALGLTDGEHERICSLLGRDPNDFELAVFSLLWSEHCGYKHSALLLKRLPSAGERVLQGPGENAGVLDLGDGLAVAFKVESHNHPSAVEPFQGAATGVGGILRDIIAMGARPVALLDGLRFAEPDWHFSRAVGGVGYYGNCLAGNESITFRNGGRARTATIAELAEERSQARGRSWMVEPARPFDVLSIDPDTHEPRWLPVSRIFKRTVPRLVKISMAAGRKLTLSEDHPVILWQDGSFEPRAASDVRPGDRIPLLAKLPRSGDPEPVDVIDAVDEPLVVRLPTDWTPTAELRRILHREIPKADRRHYWLSRGELPINAFKAVESLLGVSRQDLTVRLSSPRSNVTPGVIAIDGDFARLVGYYLAEGCCSVNGTTIRVIWTFAKSPRDARWVADVCAILVALGIRFRVEERESTTVVVVSSRVFGRLLKDVLGCGSSASEKQIPSAILQGPAELQLELLKGLFRGDGCVTSSNKGTTLKVSHFTTSERLHEQLLLLLQSFGIVPSRHERAPSPRLLGKKVKAKRGYGLELHGFDAVELCADWFGRDEMISMLASHDPAGPSKLARRRWKNHGAVSTIPVRAVEMIEGEEEVYDFEVPGTHLFVTSGGIVTHNCVGVPTVGGETVFDEAYRDNCLVNAMCVGLLPVDRVLRAKATGSGQLIVLYGATTGRDGIGGASVLASQELDESSAEKRPSVQIGDPFTGKKLIEASVELVQAGLVESLQDCGAAGIASALSEMAAEYGIDVHLDRVPQREEGMEPWEVMISESQERMVAIVRPQMTDAVREVLDRWELGHAVVGEVTESGELRAFWHDDLVGEIPARLLTEECPRYDVIFERRTATPAREISAPRQIAEALPALLASPNLRSREFVFRRYDQLVGSRTVRRPGLDAAVLRLRPSLRGLALSLDGQGRIASLDPFVGGALAVLEAARNVACAGGEPLGFTDCLNFGNPEKPEIGWELTEVIHGLAAACDALRLPIVSGNVSLYNETSGRAIHPTPVVGAVGLVPDVRLVPKAWHEGDSVFVAEASPLSLDGSEYQALYGEVGGTPGPLDLDAEARLVSFLWRAAPLCSLVHDASEGGLAVCLAEAALFSGCGAQVTLDDDPLALFGEVGGRAVLACAPDVREDVRRLGAELGVPVHGIGVAGGDTLLGVELAHLRSASEGDNN